MEPGVNQKPESDTAPFDGWPEDGGITEDGQPILDAWDENETRANETIDPGISSDQTETSAEQRATALLIPDQDLPERLPRLGRRWLITVGSLGIGLIWLVGGYLGAGLQADSSSLSVVIGILFVAALLLSGRQVLRCESERADLQYAWQARTQGLAPDASMTGPTADYLRILHDSAVRGQEAPIDRMLRVLAERLHYPGTMVGLFSNLLITLGLIGTILGLLLSVQGLNEATDTIARDPTSVTDAMGLLEAMRGAIQGMGVAFYTTLTGAVLGGVVLRILHTQVSAWIELYTGLVAEATDALFQPTLTEAYGIVGTTAQLRAAFQDLHLSAEDLRLQLEALGGQTGFMEQLHLISQHITDSVEQSSHRQSESIEQLGRDLRLMEPIGHAMRRIMGH